MRRPIVVVEYTGKDWEHLSIPELMMRVQEMLKDQPVDGEIVQGYWEETE